MYFITALLLITTSEAKQFVISSDNIIDLSYRYKEGETVSWPGYPDFDLKNTTKQSKYYTAYWFSVFEHGGTHTDSPVHFNPGKWTTDQIPPENLIGDGIRVDIREKVKNNDRYNLRVSDLEEWEQENGRIPDGAILIVYTGWGSKYGTSFYLENIDKELSFPGVSIEAAEWLIKNRNIVGIGIDTASIDLTVGYNNSHFPLGKANIYNLENVANVDKLPGPKGFTIIALPMKIAGGTGGPTRVFAFMSAASELSVCLILLVLSCFVRLL